MGGVVGDGGGGVGGGRGGGGSRSGVLQEEEASRRAAYEHAVKVADEKSKAVAARLGRGGVGGDEGGNGDEDDAEIAESLARARRLALQKQKQSVEEEAGDRVSKMVAERVKQQIASSHTESVTQNKGEIMGLDDANALDAEGRKKDGTLVFTSTTEFTTRLQAHLNEKARNRAEAAIRDMERTGEGDSDEEGAASKSSSSKRAKKILVRREGDAESGWVELDEEASMEVVAEEGVYNSASGDENESEAEEQDEQMEFLHRQPTQAKGLAATLALLKGSGDLHHKDQLAGRAKDTRDIDPSAKDFGVKLEYRDENGLKLTQKEAFRQLSYRFHGINPGTKKKNKRLREQQALLKSSGNATETGTMKSLTRAQEATGKAHITVQVLILSCRYYIVNANE
jgi:U4/U6.U5 tri-snRNP-associated protein 1